MPETGAYRADMEQVKALARATKAAGRETTGYVPACDDVACNVCRKARNERAPWNREPG